MTTSHTTAWGTIPPRPALFGPGNRPYRPGIGIMLVNDHGLILAGKRVDMKTDAWQMPQGGIDEGESVEDALWREMLEEIGTTHAEPLARAHDWKTYDFPTYLAKKLWDGRFAGQIQMWFLMRFVGKDSDIVLDNHSPEFSEVEWVEPPKLLELVIDFKRDSYRALLLEFAESLASVQR